MRAETTILTGEQIETLFREHDDLYAFGHAIAAAVLQSEQVQAWKRDAERCAEYQQLLEGAAAVLANSAEELEEGVPNECLAHEARSMAQTIFLALASTKGGTA